MNNVFAHPRDFAATVLQLRADPTADEHRPIDPPALPLVRHLQADGPTHDQSARGRHGAIPFPDPEVTLRRREQAARFERLRQVAADLDTAARAEQQHRQAQAITAARLAGEQQGTVTGWRTGFRHAIFAGVLIGVILGVATVRLAITGSIA